MMTAMASRTAFALVLLASAALGPAVTAAAEPVSCEVIAFSPDEIRDQTAFCAGMIRNDASYPTGGVRVFRTRDGERTWEQLPVTGLNLVNQALTQLIVSPNFAEDTTLYLQTLGQGLYVSSDGGTSWLLADPATVSWSGEYTLAPFTAAPAAGLPKRTVLSFADPSLPALLAPPGVHVPVTAVPGEQLVAFYLSPGFPSVPGLAAGYSTQRQSVRLYACDATLTCGTPLFTFPYRLRLSAVYFANDYRTSGTVYAVTAIPWTETRGLLHEFWRSTDGGKTFARWTAVQRLMPPRKYDRDDKVGLALNPRRPGEMFLFVNYFGAPTGVYRAAPSYPSPPYPPGNQVFRSTDNGVRWTRVSFGTFANTLDTAPARGSIPWWAPGGAPHDVAPIYLTDRGRLLVLAGRSFKDWFYCSADQGRTWKAQACPR